MKHPLISVIIPAYNCEKTIETAIESIVNQTYPNIEIIVVDDSSTDGTYAVANAMARNNPSIKVIQSPADPCRFDGKLQRNVNAGYSARNAGLAAASGDLITFQDADDASLLNRIEAQFELLSKTGSTHLCVDWVKFDVRYLNKRLDVEAFSRVEPRIVGPRELSAMAQRSKGLVSKLSPALNRLVPFHMKRKRFVNKLFFGTLENYPGPGNSPLFKREVIDKVRFRPLKERVWPSFMGRGADKDFNFQVAETFKNSHVAFLPLYLWRVKDQNPRYPNGIDEVIM